MRDEFWCGFCVAFASHHFFKIIEATWKHDKATLVVSGLLFVIFTFFAIRNA